MDSLLQRLHVSFKTLKRICGKVKEIVESDSIIHYPVIIDTTYRGIHEKGSGDVVSAVCYPINYISIPLHTNSRDDISRTLFSNSPVRQDPHAHNNHKYNYIYVYSTVGCKATPSDLQK